MKNSEYADKIIELIEARPPGISSDQLLYEVYTKLKVAEGLHAIAAGEVYPHETVVEEMWQIINSKSSGADRHDRISKGSSPKSRQPRR